MVFPWPALTPELVREPLPRGGTPFALVARGDVAVVGIYARHAPRRRAAFEREVEIPDRRQVVLLPVHEEHRHRELFEEPIVLERPAQELLALILLAEGLV